MWDNLADILQLHCCEKPVKNWLPYREAKVEELLYLHKNLAGCTSNYNIFSHYSQYLCALWSLREKNYKNCMFSSIYIQDLRLAPKIRFVRFVPRFDSSADAPLFFYNLYGKGLLND